ncbi:MAG: prepilin-type N-terminal cleavage/methylation domain-containing protein [Thermodesulfobacteriota bacterium]
MKKKGFTLIELIIVLLLAGLAVSLVTPSLFRLSKTAELRGMAQKISAILRYCRSESIHKRQVYQVLFDSHQREVRVRSMEDEKVTRRYALPEGIQIEEVKIPSPQYLTEVPTIEFYPNGGSNGGSILVGSRDRKGYMIKVHFLTGIVEIEKV